MDGSISNVSCSFAVHSVEKPHRTENGALQASELSGTYTKPHPTSVSSARDDSPSTPLAGDSEQTYHRKYGYNPPKLDRTMTDVYGDELYNPNFVITSTSPPQSHSATSASSDVFSQRINAANHQHLSAVQSPGSSGSRARSPFQTSSPFSSSSSRGIVATRFPSAQCWSEREQKSETQNSHLGSTAEPETPKTISPRDAILEFNEAEADWVLPLFPHNSSTHDIDSLPKSMYTKQCDATYSLSTVANSQPRDLGGMPSQVLTGVQIPQQYPFIANPSASRDSPPRLSSSGASSVASGDNTPDCHRPTNTGADGGTYTCTYHGCSLRFDTPTTLQKHKREGHRQTQTLVSSRLEPRLMSNVLHSQAGPHRCDRINPSTGKSCNTVFSRPYDLTRHEDTIHNARKQKVRCNLCTDEKSFSRADALTRHYRVCHPDMEFPSKFRRKGGA
ncbi:hypothetical protein E4U43_005214 [Claviceps pusilla]|uniref:C2H2-type domain-containing protein n=1 Tax=Claviceps pusilla TaxID=123648 RepID=A0A9P7NIZ6_9HYPO|nr:hypothetical protein E4U43_005214 [Claviceps pusilla]